MLLVMNGRPLDLRWAAENVPAILDIVPRHPRRRSRGRPAIRRCRARRQAAVQLATHRWPAPDDLRRTVSHDPRHQDQRYWDEASTPLFPFRHGLSYGQFEYRDLNLDRNHIQPGQTVTASVTVTDIGEHAGDEVAQLYIRQRHGSASRPVRELKGFQRISLAAGESRTLTFPLGPAELRYWNAAARDWVIDITTIDVFAGSDSTADLTTSFTIGS